MKLGRVTRVAVVTATFAVAAALTGCVSDATAEPSGSDQGQPTPGGVLRYLTSQEAATLDPAFDQTGGNASGGVQALFAIYDSLLVINSETGTVEPRIALSLESQDSNREWLLELREGVEFSDGTPLNAEAVKYNWERIKDPAIASTLAPFAAPITEMEVVSPLALLITLDAPDRDFDALVAHRLGFIGSPTAIESAGDAFSENPVGAGPFLLTDWVRDSYKEFERNPDYYDAPRPYVEGLRIDVTTDGNQLRNIAQARQADIVYSLNLVDIEPLEEAGMDSIRVLTPGSPNVILNNTRPPFDDKTVRRALAQAVDMEQMAANTQAFQFVAGPFPDGSPFNFGLELPAYDPQSAQEAFDDYAGRTGGPLTFTLSAFNDTTNRSMATYLQSALNSYDNVQVEVEFASTGAGVGKVMTGEYDANTWGSLYATPDQLGINLGTGMPDNVMKYTSQAVDEAIVELAAAMDETAADAPSKTIVESLVADTPFLSLGARASTNLFHENVSGVAVYWDGIPDLARIWLVQ